MQNSEAHIYDITIDWKEGKIGTMGSDKLEQHVEVATPPEFPGGIAGIWSPEHLFVASVGSCLMTSFAAIAEYSNLEFESLKVNAFGTLSRVEGKFVMSKITLKPILTIIDEKHEKKAYRLLEKAENICLISNSIKSEIVFEPEVKILVTD